MQVNNLYILIFLLGITLLVLLYLNNKNEHFTQENFTTTNEAVQNIASIVNNQSVTLSNISTTGNLSVDRETKLNGNIILNGTTTAKDINSSNTISADELRSNRVRLGGFLANEINDTRKTNENPATYRGRPFMWEFKEDNAIKLSSNGGYCLLNTIKGWGDSSGGPVHQLALCANGTMNYRTSKSENDWNDWQQAFSVHGGSQTNIIEFYPNNEIIAFNRESFINAIRDGKYFTNNMPDGTTKQFLFVHRGDRNPSHLNRWFWFGSAVKFGKQFLLFKLEPEHHGVPDPKNNNSNDQSWRGNIL